MNKIVGLLIVGLLIATIIPIGVSEAEKAPENKVVAIALFKNKSSDHQVTGFVFFGMHNGEVIKVTQLTINYYGELRVTKSGPFLWAFQYTPA